MSRHSPKEIERIKRIAASADFRKSVAKGLSVAPVGSADSPWPAREVVAKLVESADILLDEHDYDGHGHELISYARQVARDWLRKNGKPSDIC